MEQCLSGAYDLHVHPHPDIIERKFDDIELAKMATKAQMAGFAIKSHYVPTADRAYYARREVPGVNVFGGLCLNNAVGGLNPQAVDIFGRSGGKVVWMPTVDSLNESRRLEETGSAKSHYWSRMQLELEKDGILKPPISILDEKGNILPVMDEIISLIIKYKLILATGHLSPDESIKLIKHASEMGLEKIIVTHPESPSTFFTIEQQKSICKYGVFLERSYRVPAIGFSTFDHVLKEIKETGIERNILATDLGQTDSISPVEGMAELSRFLLKNGYKVDEIRQMSVENQEFLVR